MNISCEVRANPKATIMWVKNKRQSASRTLRDLRKDDVTISTLEFEEVTKSSSGIYVIEATNSIGSSRTEVEISVIGNCFVFSLVPNEQHLTMDYNSWLILMGLYYAVQYK